MKRMKFSIIGILFLLGAASLLPMIPATASSHVPPSHMELSLESATFTPYTSEYKTSDALIAGKSIDLNFITGFRPLKDHTSADLSGFTFESDDIPLTSGVTLYDRNTYSKTMLNDTWNSGVATNVTIVSEFVISDRSTIGTATANSDGTGTRQVYWDSLLSFDENGDGDYVDSGDKAYLPLGGSEYFYIMFSVDFLNATINSATYASISLVFERSSGTDYTVEIKAFEGSGDTGWVLSTSNGATFNAYDADEAYLGLVIPLEDLYVEDSSETGNILGLDYIRVKMSFGAVNEAITITVKNIAVFDSLPAITDATDDDGDYDYNDANGIPAGLHDSDSDILGTKISEGATESYDWTIPLLADQSGSMTLLKNVRKAKFTGTFAVDPSTWGASSEPVSGQTYYLTTEQVTFDTTGIDSLTSLSNVLSVSNWKLNVTIDDALLPFTTDYEDNLVSFTVNGLDKYYTFRDAWAAASVTDGSEVQYDISDPSSSTGAIDNIVMKYYTKSSFSGLAGGAAGGGSAGLTGFVNQNMTLVLIVVVAAGAVGIYWWKSQQKGRRRRWGR